MKDSILNYAKAAELAKDNSSFYVGASFASFPGKDKMESLFGKKDARRISSLAEKMKEHGAYDYLEIKAKADLKDARDWYDDVYPGLSKLSPAVMK